MPTKIVRLALVLFSQFNMTEENKFLFLNLENSLRWVLEFKRDMQC